MFKKFADPTKFPAVWSFIAGSLRFDVLIASAAAWVAMKMNAKAINGAELKVLKASRPEGVTVDDIKALVGDKFRSPLVNEADPDVTEAICLTHGGTFQPIRYKAGEEFRGSFTEFKAERLVNLPDDVREEVKATLAKTTKQVFGDRVPKNIMIAAKCPDCIRAERRGKDKVIVTYLTLAQVRDQASGHDARISAAQRRNYVNSLFGSKREEGRKTFNRGVRGQRRPDDRPRAEFHGANFLEDTTAVLTAAEKSGKLTGGLEQLSNASNEFLQSLGIQGSERAFDAIRTIASRTLEKAEQAEAINRAASEAGAKLGDVFPDKAKGFGKKKSTRRGKNTGPRQSKADRISN